LSPKIFLHLTLAWQNHNMSTFITEPTCYEILKRANISIPKYFVAYKIDDIAQQFLSDEKVVIKGIIEDLWHKSDVGMVAFTTFSNAKKIYQEMESKADKKKWNGCLISETVSFHKGPLPTELLLSIQDDSSLGTIITFGFGGVHTELLNPELKQSVFNWSIEITSPHQAYEQLEQTLLWKILTGNTRDKKQLISEKELKSSLVKFWALANICKNESISLLEINPIVIKLDGAICGLDGVGLRGKNYTPKQLEINNESLTAIISPKSIAIVGVSSTKVSFGNIILENIKKSEIAKENIFIVNKTVSTYNEITSVASISALPNVDVIILAIPASTCLEAIKEICSTKKSPIIYLVAGGIGDSADFNHLIKKDIESYLHTLNINQRARIIGPNSLGIILAEIKLNTLFIPESKLNINFHSQGTIAFIAQSGAFFITRLSRNHNLPIKYGFCIGNQLDLNASDMINVLSTDSSIKVIALYLEGPPNSDALTLAKTIKNIPNSKKVVIYRAGRSKRGMKAAAGHTGSLASNYDLEKKILTDAGGILFEDFSKFESTLLAYGYYPSLILSNKKNIAIITNAGFESVSSADILDSSLATLTEENYQELSMILTKYGITNLVSPSNPLDLTPMANEDVYLECIEVFCKDKRIDCLVVGIVPLTAMLETYSLPKAQEKIKQLSELSCKYRKTILVTIDAGNEYYNYKESFFKYQIPVFNSIQDAFCALTTFSRVN